MGDLNETLRDIETVKSILKRWNVGDVIVKDVMYYARQVASRQLNNMLDGVNDDIVDGLNEKERELIKTPVPGSSYANKIPVIKMVRERTGQGLAEAKYTVENYMYLHGLFNQNKPIRYNR